MTTSRMFPLGSVLSVTTGRFLADDLDQVYDILNFLTGDSLITHQLPRAIRTAQPYVLIQYPGLRGVEPPQDASSGEVFLWLAETKKRFGVALPVAPLPPGVWEHLHPLEELALIRRRPRT